MTRLLRSATTLLLAGRFSGFGFLTCMLALGLAPTADAANFRLIDVQCITPQEKDANGDELRMTITADAGFKQVHRQNNMKKGAIWGFDQTMMQCHKSVRINLTELDTVGSDGIHFQDEDLGSMTLVAEPFNEIRTAVFQKSGAHYVIRYQFIVNPAREIEIVSVLCKITQEKDSDGDELRLRIKADDGKEITLSKNGVKKGSVWSPGKKVQFLNKVRLTLVEEDGFGIHFQDETLGSTTITATQPRPFGTETRTVTFTGHGSNYVITFRIKN